MTIITKRLFNNLKFLIFVNCLPIKTNRYISFLSSAYSFKIKSLSFKNLSFSSFSFKRPFMDLTSVIKIIEEKIPPHLSEDWDNTGLLIEPSNKVAISTILLTNDLTLPVLEEALSNKSDLIISYHPPIFAPMKVLSKSNWKDLIVIKCLENSVAVYSPHTSCDAVKDGVNDWLISCFELSDCHPIHTSFERKPLYSHILEFDVPQGSDICQLLKHVPDSELYDKITEFNSPNQKCKLKVNKTSLDHVVQLLAGKLDTSSLSITALNPLPMPSCGMGRIGTLVKPLSLRECIALVKSHLKLDFIRFSQSVSHSLESSVSTVAVCAGSGSSVLKGTSADLYVTGEMSHHDLLDANHRNISVILCEHSNSERGYLKHLADALSPKLTGIKFIISSSDKDPVSIM